MKKIVKIIYIIVIFITIILSFNFILNEIFIFKYNNGKYNESMLNLIRYINVSEPYIVFYNIANIKYQNKEYDEAILNYEKALNLFPSKKKECDIRINLVLAMLKKIDVESQKKEDIITVLDNAVDILCEKGCANKNDNNGHSKDAETLKNEILNLKNKLNNTNSKDIYKDKNNDNEKNNKDDEKKSDIEKKLKEIERQAIKERNLKLDRAQKWSSYSSYYGGKKW